MRKKIITRFAPSPTGHLHIGGIRTALFSWIYAKKHNGDFLLRIEDSDFNRYKPEAVKIILDSLGWLGIHVDNQPYYQSHHIDRYKEIITYLLKHKKAYRCYCSQDRLNKLRQHQIDNKEKPRYDGHCRKYLDIKQTSYVVRFKNPKDGTVSWFDDVKKHKITFENHELDDFIIQRSNGTPTYHLCVVVDDIDMNISNIIRGDDHISNTPKQINLYNALNKNIPNFAHLPMVLGTDRKKLSKRDSNIINIMEYKEKGYLPEAIINYLVRLGWSYGNKEIFNIKEIMQSFKLENVNSSASMFNIDKLNWLNKYYLSHLPIDKIMDYLQFHFKKEQLDITKGPKLQEIIPIMSQKANTLQEIVNKSLYFYQDFNNYNPKAVVIYFNKKSKKILQLALYKYQNMDHDNWENTSKLFNIIKNISQLLNVPIGKVGMPIRVAITGNIYSPSIALTIKWIGRERTLNRLKNAITFIN